MIEIHFIFTHFIIFKSLVSLSRKDILNPQVMIIDDNWGLHAVVHECTQQAQEGNLVDIEEELFDMGQPLPFDLSSPMSFDLHELEDLYKPFCANTSEMAYGSNVKQFIEIQHSVVHQQYDLFGGSSYLLPVGTNTAFVTAAASNRAKRKNQQKRVIQHVTANGLSTDLWAWRKYGQKPIKGSFYPRSYYRCSSSKGCAARKQVEQSSLDPNIFTITYSEDHNHPHPTHRSSLSGISKNKKASSTPPKKPARFPLKIGSSSNTPILNMSPATPLMQENATGDNGIKEECVAKGDDDSIMNLGLGFEKEIAEMGFDVDQSWFPHWLDGRSVC